MKLNQFHTPMFQVTYNIYININLVCALWLIEALLGITFLSKLNIMDLY